MKRPLPAAIVSLASLVCLGCPLTPEPLAPTAPVAMSEETPSAENSERENSGEEPTPESRSANPPTPGDPQPASGNAAKLLQRIDSTLQDNLANRRLSIEQHGAWQILHGVLAYGEQFPVQTAEGQQAVVPYLLSGNPMRGFDPTPGHVFDEDPEEGDRTDASVGLRMPMDVGTKVGQGHRDQWLAIFSQCDLPLETELRASGRTFTLADWMRQAEYDVPRNLELEFSWTLIALSHYRDTEHVWRGRDGVRYSVEDLLRSELQQSLESSVCGGTHRLIGIASILNKRRAEEEPIIGVWAEAQRVLAEAVELARKNQNPDGSYSVSYLHRSGWARDLGETLGTTGHVLEFLAFAAPDREITDPWVQRSAARLCDVLEQCHDIDLECGVLYHALHGLSEYRERMRELQTKRVARQ